MGTCEHDRQDDVCWECKDARIAALEMDRAEAMALVLSHEGHIARLEAELAAERESYRKWGILPCPSCSAANERVATLQSKLDALRIV